MKKGFYLPDFPSVFSVGSLEGYFIYRFFNYKKHFFKQFFVFALSFIKCEKCVACLFHPMFKSNQLWECCLLVKGKRGGCEGRLGADTPYGKAKAFQIVQEAVLWGSGYAVIHRAVSSGVFHHHPREGDWRVGDEVRFVFPQLMEWDEEVDVVLC